MNALPPLAWQLDPVLIGTLVTLALVYALAIGPLRERLAPGAPFPRGRAAVYATGLILLYLLEGSPLHDLAERYLLSAHMVQHLLIAYLVAPLLIRGTPEWLLRAVLLHPVVKPLARVLLHPVVAFAVFSLAFSAWHLPAFYDGALRNPALHHAEHVLFLGTALIVWWPILSPLPELPRLGYGLQIVYLFLLPIAQIPVFGAITFADRVLYATYAAAPRVWLADPMHDQALAGALMKVAGLFAFGVPLATRFFAWFSSESGARRTRAASPSR